MEAYLNIFHNKTILFIYYIYISFIIINHKKFQDLSQAKLILPNNVQSLKKRKSTASVLDSKISTEKDTIIDLSKPDTVVCSIYVMYTSTIFTSV
jgi:hypothetical protein